MRPPLRRERRANGRRLVNHLTTRFDTLSPPEPPKTRAEARRLLRAALWIGHEPARHGGPNRAALRHRPFGPNGGPRT